MTTSTITNRMAKNLREGDTIVVRERGEVCTIEVHFTGPYTKTGMVIIVGGTCVLPNGNHVEVQKFYDWFETVEVVR